MDNPFGVRRPSWSRLLGRLPHPFCPSQSSRHQRTLVPAGPVPPAAPGIGKGAATLPVLRVVTPHRLGSTLPLRLQTYFAAVAPPLLSARPAPLKLLVDTDFPGETDHASSTLNGSAFPPEPDPSQRARRSSVRGPRRARPQGLAARRERQAGSSSPRVPEDGWRLAVERTRCPSVPCASARALAASRLARSPALAFARALLANRRGSGHSLWLGRETQAAAQGNEAAVVVAAGRCRARTSSRSKLSPRTWS